ncbi:MAG: hypothetical protein IJ629_03105 [Clostridia bacterium]|nr:hypothetical protein [Clostridia bacterium]
MITEKQRILETVNELPDNITWDDAIYTLYLRSKLEESKKNIKEGNTITLEELKEFIDGLEARYEADNS